MAVDLTNETDVGLLLLIGGATDIPADQLLAREALRELHSRYYGYVLGVLEKYAEFAGTLSIDPKEWASKTFVKAFENAGSFSDQSGGDALNAAGQVRAWLGVLAQNAARDELDRLRREHRRLPTIALEELHFSTVPATAPDDTDCCVAYPTPPALLRGLREVLESLKPEERDIMMTYAEFGEPTPAGRELPAQVREALEDRTGYERSNIRQKWRRLSQRLKSELEPLLSTRQTSSLHA